MKDIHERLCERISDLEAENESLKVSNKVLEEWGRELESDLLKAVKRVKEEGRPYD